MLFVHSQESDLKTIRLTRLTTLIILIGLLQPAFADLENAPAVTADGLHRIPDSKLSLVYAEPGADLTGYQRILLVDAQVAFRKNWKRDTNINKPYSITNQKMQDIRVKLSALFGEIFSAALVSANYTLTDERAEDVLIVRPAIMDLDIMSPQTASGRTRNITRSAGAMTLYLELRDAVTGDILIKALDYQYDLSEVTPYMQDSTRNERAAREILTGWAQILVNGLDEARSAALPMYEELD
jgi:hypothetical protein